MTTQESIELNKELNIKIDLGHDDDENLIQAKILVVRKFEVPHEDWYDIGMEFLSIDPSDKAAIEKTIIEIGFIGVSIYLMYFWGLLQKIRVMFNKYSMQYSGYVVVLFSLFMMSFYSLTIGSFYYCFVLGLTLASIQSDKFKLKDR